MAESALRGAVRRAIPGDPKSSVRTAGAVLASAGNRGRQNAPAVEKPKGTQKSTPHRGCRARYGGICSSRRDTPCDPVGIRRAVFEPRVLSLRRQKTEVGKTHPRSKSHEAHKKAPHIGVPFYGDSWRNRTAVTAVKGPCLNLLTNEPDGSGSRI